jgi:hypothetical protein
MLKINTGDSLYTIFCYDNKLYATSKLIKKVTSKDRIIASGFFQGVKIGALNQFNQDYRTSCIRGNNLYMFRCHSLKSELADNIKLFKKRYFKLTHVHLQEEISVLAHVQKDIEPEFVDFVNKNFWDLI